MNKRDRTGRTNPRSLQVVSLTPDTIIIEIPNGATDDVVTVCNFYVCA
jgi:hypothetical protein